METSKSARWSMWISILIVLGFFALVIVAWIASTYP
jgi:hypothetical protein